MGEPIEPQADAGTVGSVLSYRTPAAVPPLPPARRTVAFRIAFGCWLVPLVFGSAIYILSEVVRRNVPPNVTLIPTHGDLKPQSHAFAVMIDLGLLDLALGTLLAAVGAAAVLTFVARRWAPAVDRWRQVIRPAGVLLALIASNFAVAATLASLAIR